MSEKIFELENIRKKFNNFSNEINSNAGIKELLKSEEVQELISLISLNLIKMNEITANPKVKKRDKEKEIEEIFKNLKDKVTDFKNQLKEIPYSNNETINMLLKKFNELLGKLADFIDGPLIVHLNVAIPVPDWKPHNFVFFHPAQSIIRDLDSVSSVLGQSVKSVS